MILYQAIPKLGLDLLYRAVQAELRLSCYAKPRQRTALLSEPLLLYDLKLMNAHINIFLRLSKKYSIAFIRYSADEIL